MVGNLSDVEATKRQLTRGCFKSWLFNEYSSGVVFLLGVLSCRGDESWLN